MITKCKQLRLVVEEDKCWIEYDSKSKTTKHPVDGNLTDGFNKLMAYYNGADWLEDKKPICPKCGSTYSGRPAISRVDNKTEICPSCGLREALEAFARAVEGDIQFSYQRVVSWRFVIQ